MTGNFVAGSLKISSENYNVQMLALITQAEYLASWISIFTKKEKMQSCTAEDSQRNFSVDAPQISQLILPQKIQSIFPENLLAVRALLFPKNFQSTAKIL